MPPSTPFSSPSTLIEYRCKPNERPQRFFSTSITRLRAGKHCRITLNVQSLRHADGHAWPCLTPSRTELIWSVVNDLSQLQRGCRFGRRATKVQRASWYKRSSNAILPSSRSSSYINGHAQSPVPLSCFLQRRPVEPEQTWMKQVRTDSFPTPACIEVNYEHAEGGTSHSER